jgi:hypothetical protein
MLVYFSIFGSLVLLSLNIMSSVLWGSLNWWMGLWFQYTHNRDVHDDRIVYAQAF